MRKAKVHKVTAKKFDAAICQAHAQGVERGRTQGALDERKKIEYEIDKQKAQTNLKALEQITNLARATAQAIEAISRAMYDGRGQ